MRDQILRTIGQGFLGESHAAVAIREQIADFLEHHSTEDPPPPILLRGELGVGKSLLARSIHEAGPRRTRPFIMIRCAATRPSRLEHLLFGQEHNTFSKVRGVSTRMGKPGIFQAAHGSTMFLDNVEALPAELQSAVVKALKTRSVRRVGGVRDEPVNVWIIAGTSEDLRGQAEYHRRYREAFSLQEPFAVEELYQYVALDLLLPPLRQRSEDIVLLAEHALASFCAEKHLQPKSFTPDAHRALLAYPWPGNVREVEELIKRAVLLSPERDLINAAMLALPDV